MPSFSIVSFYKSIACVSIGGGIIFGSITSADTVPGSGDIGVVLWETVMLQSEMEWWKSQWHFVIP